MMIRRAILAPIFLSALLVTQWACGRDALQRSCMDNGDCAEGEVCAAGICRDPTVSDDMPQPDASVDLPDALPDFPDPPDFDDDLPDLPQMMCASTSECPGGGDQYEQSGGCFESTCLANNCVYDGIDLRCPPSSRQQGCDCVPVDGECVDSEDCNGQACVNNMCRPCRTNAECGDLTCQEDGRCAPCAEDLDCAADQVCRAGSCKPRPECLLDDDCGEQEICLSGRCSFSPECDNNDDCSPGYECVGDRCFEAICRGPEDCAPEELCDAGVCVEQPSTIDRCFVATPNATVSPGQRVTLEAFAVDSDGNGVATRFDWTSSAPSVAAVSNTNAVAGNQAGAATITARLKNSPLMCDGQVTLTNIGPPPANNFRVVVRDAESGAPLSNVEVYVNSAAMTLTDSAGVTTSALPAIPYEISVFSSDHDWVTIQQVSATDIIVPLNRRSGSGPIGGFRGQFDTSALSSQGDFDLGLAGASLPGGLINFDLERLLGEPFLTNVSIPTQGDVDFPLPGGLTVYGSVFGFPIEVKRDYYATSPGGARLAWGLAGKVPVNELLGLFQGGFDNIGDVLSLLLPLFNRFDHGIKPLLLNALPRVIDTFDVDGDGDLVELVPDYDNFPTEDIRPSVRQQLVTSVDVSNLPLLSAGPAEFAILVGGTTLPSTGFVPLGISATVDDDGDGRPDIRRLTMAPPYGSIVGGRYVVFSIAFRGDAFGGGLNGLEFPDEFSAALWNGQALPTSIQLGTFPNTSFAFEDPLQRALYIDGTAGPLYRARMVSSDRSWDIWSLGPPGSMGFFSHVLDIPALPPGKPDLYQNATTILLDSIRTQVQINDLLTPAGIPLYEAALVSTGYSRTRLR